MATNFVRCENGHLYNAAEHVRCPYCTPTESAYTQYMINSYDDENVTVRSTASDGKDVPRFVEAQEGAIGEERTVKYNDQNESKRDIREGATVKLSEAGSGFNREQIDPVAVALSVSAGMYQPGSGNYSGYGKDAPADFMSESASRERTEETARGYEDRGTEHNGYRKPETRRSIGDGAAFSFPEPVGWLICIEGPDFGKSYPLKEGRNSIGRSEEMDVTIRGDLAVSRRNHAWIEYREEGRQFIVSVGEARKMIYVNDDLLLTSLSMEKNDILALGNSSLMLIPCCDSVFSWKSVNSER